MGSLTVSLSLDLSGYASVTSCLGPGALTGIIPAAPTWSLGRKALPRKPAFLLKVRPSFLEIKRTRLPELYFEFLFLWSPMIDRAPVSTDSPDIGAEKRRLK